MPQPLVLIVDDNPENLSVLGALLPRHAAQLADGGQRGLQRARGVARRDGLGHPDRLAGDAVPWPAMAQRHA